MPAGELSALISRKIRLRFRLARAVSSTRYVIFGPDRVEDLARRPGAASGHVVKALPDPLGGTGLGREIKQALVGFRVPMSSAISPMSSTHRQSDRTRNRISAPRPTPSTSPAMRWSAALRRKRLAGSAAPPLWPAASPPRLGRSSTSLISPPPWWQTPSSAALPRSQAAASSRTAPSPARYEASLMPRVSGRPGAQYFGGNVNIIK